MKPEISSSQSDVNLEAAVVNFIAGTPAKVPDAVETSPTPSEEPASAAGPRILLLNVMRPIGGGSYRCHCGEVYLGPQVHKCLPVAVRG